VPWTSRSGSFTDRVQIMRLGATAAGARKVQVHIKSRLMEIGLCRPVFKFFRALIR